MHFLIYYNYLQIYYFLAQFLIPTTNKVNILQRLTKMKVNLLLLILFFFTNIKCISQQKTEINKNISNINPEKQKIEKVELQEQTRGTNRIITFEPTFFNIFFNGNTTKTELSTIDWENITKQASLIDLSKISSYESPTTGRFSDRALSCTIIITSEGKTYKSSTFDAGIPPKELEGLYQLLKSKSGIIKRSTPRFR